MCYQQLIHNGVEELCPTIIANKSISKHSQAYHQSRAKIKYVFFDAGERIHLSWSY
jgi:hypothetical protein